MEDYEICEEIESEVERAEARYGPFASSHEGLGVLTEEYKELCDAIHSNDIDAIIREAIQMSAVSRRLAVSMTLVDTINRSQK